MDIEKEFKKMKAYIYKWHKKDKGEWFPDVDSEGSEKENIDLYIKEILSDTQNEIKYLSLYFQEMASWKMNQSQYALLYKEDQDSFYKAFSESAEYAYLELIMDQKRAFDLGMPSVGFTLALQCLLKNEDKYKMVAEAMLYSLHHYIPEKHDKQGVGVIIGNGRDDIVSAWFMLDLYCLAYERSYDKDKASLPINYAPYDEVLQEWDTTDIQKVDKLVYKLCEMHILRGIRSGDMDKDWFQEFAHNEQQLFPFEILVWLQMRKDKGLKNPEKYTHYFMQEPLAKSFPLDAPLELPSIPHIELLKIEHPELYAKYLRERKNG